MLNRLPYCCSSNALFHSVSKVSQTWDCCKTHTPTHWQTHTHTNTHTVSENGVTLHSDERLVDKLCWECLLSHKASRQVAVWRSTRGLSKLKYGLDTAAILQTDSTGDISCINSHSHTLCLKACREKLALCHISHYSQGRNFTFKVFYCSTLFHWFFLGHGLSALF